MRFKTMPAAALAALAAVALRAACGSEAGRGMALFDTGEPSAGPWTAEAVAGKTGWTRIEEGKTPAAFRGDVALANDMVTVVLRSASGGGEVYSKSAGGLKPRASFLLLSAGTVSQMTSFKAVENTADSVAVGAQCRGGAAAGFALKAGEPILKTEARSGLDGLRITAPSRFGILPDFFADDMIVDATVMPVERTEVPGENFFMSMLDKGNAIVSAVWDRSDRDVLLGFSGAGAQKVISSVDLFYGKGSIWICVLDRGGIWHQADVAAGSKGPRALEWEVPFDAKWKGNFTRADHTVTSWVFEKPALKKGVPQRGRWSGVVGNFDLPCWFEGEGQVKASIEPPAAFSANVKASPVEGPFIVYPIERSEKTPLDALTVVDLMRNSMGIGPCEAVIDMVAAGSLDKGIYTCSLEAVLPGIFDLGKQKQERVFLGEMCSNVVVFVTAIQDRINGYVDFRGGLLAYLDAQKKAHPETGEFAARMEALAKGIGERRADGGPKVAALAGQLRDAIDADTLRVNPHAIAAQIAGIGLGQDNRVAQCRLAVKEMRRAATIEATVNPAAAEMAKEIRKRTQAILRNPLGHEMM